MSVLAVVHEDLQLLAVFPVRVVRLALEVVAVADFADLDELRGVLRVFALPVETAFVDGASAEGAGERGVPVEQAVGLAGDEALGVFAELVRVAELVEDGGVWSVERTLEGGLFRGNVLHHLDAGLVQLVVFFGLQVVLADDVLLALGAV